MKGDYIGTFRQLPGYINPIESNHAEDIIQKRNDEHFQLQKHSERIIIISSAKISFSVAVFYHNSLALDGLFLFLIGFPCSGNSFPTWFQKNVEVNFAVRTVSNTTVGRVRKNGSKASAFSTIQ